VKAEIDVAAVMQLIEGIPVVTSLILGTLAASSISRDRLCLADIVGLVGYALGSLASSVSDLPAGVAIIRALVCAASLVGEIARVDGLRAVRRCFRSILTALCLHGAAQDPPAMSATGKLEALPRSG
jgi:hypothetical protein